MLQTTVALSIVAVILIMVNAKLSGRHMEGLKAGLKQALLSIPLIIVAFILAGMLEVLIPREFVQSWLSREAGLKGIVLGTFGGMLLAGPLCFVSHYCLHLGFWCRAWDGSRYLDRLGLIGFGQSPL